MKLIKHKISSEHLKKGQKYYLVFCTVTGIALTFVAENIIILYSVKVELPDYLIAVVTSFIYLSAPFMFIGRLLIKRYGAVRTLSVALLFRYFFISFLLFVPFVAANISIYSAFLLVVLGAFGFYASKNVGVVGWTPLVGELAEEKSQTGKLLSKGFFAFTTAYFFSLFALRHIFSKYDSIDTFRVIISLGIVLGIISSFIIARLPETDSLKKSASNSLYFSFKKLWRNKTVWVLILSQTIYMSSIALIVPFCMLALKKGYFVSDYDASAYLIIQLSGGIIATLFCKKLLDSVGPKKVIIIFYVLFIASAILWIMAPLQFSYLYCFIIFFTAGLARIGGLLSYSHYFLLITPPEKRITTTLFITVISSTIAGIMGSLFGGGILKAIEYCGITGINLYRYYFLFILLFLSFGFIIILYFERFNPFRIMLSARKLIIGRLNKKSF